MARPDLAPVPSEEQAGPPCLLTMPTYGGTLAAVRALGSRGVKVTVAGSEWLAPARWSRYAQRFLRCPEPRQVDRFLEWLLRFGEREPGHFLYPTSDDLAWLFASHAADLGKHFLLFQPPVSTLVKLLDKKRLYAACTEVGLPTMPTWFPSGLEDVVRLGPELPLPLVIKPRTQVMLSTWNHGRVIDDRGELVRRYREWLALDRYLPGLEDDFGDLAAPMLQSFSDCSGQGVYSLAGFVDRGGALQGVRAARKVVQRPNLVGVGLCFEDVPVDPGLLDGVVRLCRRVGYFGVFEVEFVAEGGQQRLIDFNPRYYGQMHFETARNLPLPVFAYLAAQGDRAGLASLSDEARGHDSRGSAYSFQLAHRLLLTMRRLAGTAAAEEPAQWRAWYAKHRKQIVDPSADRDDWVPGLVQVATELWRPLRHPRAYYRQSILDRS